MSAAPPNEALCRSWITAVQAHCRQPEQTSRSWLEALGIRRVDGGRNNRLFVCTLHGSPAPSCCLKLYRTDQRDRDGREWRTLTFLAAQCPGLAPRPILHAPDPVAPVVAMEFVPGQPLLDLLLTDQHLLALADRLTDLYRLPPALGRFSETAGGALEPILVRVSQWATTGASAIRSLLCQWLVGPDPLLLRAPAPVVFGVGDPNLANWLWDAETKTLRRVDWEYAGWSDLACELANLIEGPWARSLTDPAWLAFVEQFPALDYDRFAAARRLFALFWVGVFAERADDRLAAQTIRAIRATTLLEER